MRPLKGVPAQLAVTPAMEPRQTGRRIVPAANGTSTLRFGARLHALYIY